MDRRLGSALAAIATNVRDAFRRRGYTLDEPEARYDADAPADACACLRATARVSSEAAAARIATADVSYVEGTEGALEALRAFRVRAHDVAGARVLVLVADVQDAAYPSRGVAHAETVALPATAVASAFAVAETDVGLEEAPAARLVLVLWHAPAVPFAPDVRLGKQLHKHAGRFRSVELFTRAELLVDVFTHTLQPPIIRLVEPASAGELAWLEREYMRLHGLERSDPVVRRLAAEPGAVLEFVRSSARLGATHVLRRVLGGSARQQAAERDRWRAVVVSASLRAGMGGAAQHA